MNVKRVVIGVTTTAAIGVVAAIGLTHPSGTSKANITTDKPLPAPKVQIFAPAPQSPEPAISADEPDQLDTSTQAQPAGNDTAPASNDPAPSPTPAPSDSPAPTFYHVVAGPPVPVPKQ